MKSSPTSGVITMLPAPSPTDGCMPEDRGHPVAGILRYHATARETVRRSWRFPLPVTT
jgi:hypothetical protein